MSRNVFTQASVYVGTYQKYNNASLEGDWLSLSDYDSKEEFIQACRELHSDEEDPELMFQDWEGIPEGFISECSISSFFFDLKEELQEGEEEAFLEWSDFQCLNQDKEDAHSLVARFRDEFCGAYDSEEEYARMLFDELYAHEVPESISYYIDYSAFARDLFMCDYLHTGTYVFRR